MGGKIDWLTGCRHRVRYSHFVIKTGICASIEGLWSTTAEITEQNIRWRKRVQKAFSSCMYNHLRAVELHVWTTFYKWTPQISRFRIENIQNMQITVHIASLTVQIIGRTYSTILWMQMWYIFVVGDSGTAFNQRQWLPVDMPSWQNSTFKTRIPIV